MPTTSLAPYELVEAPSDAALLKESAGALKESAAAVLKESAAIYPDTNPGPPSPEEIAREAYNIYLSRGAADGYDMDDWLEAERRLRT